ncbi:MAG: P-loop NTPase [Simkaniaceae bacterium]|nr:P-loop NTPase [Simkaniaceae bacterium]
MKYIGIASGKGGVGKSTVTINLALALQNQGCRVGIIDADVYGPSIAAFLGIDEVPSAFENIMKPAMSQGIKLMSVSFFKAPYLAVRAPIANQIITQMIQQVEWGDLDYLLIDFPPGTGDIQLTLLQTVPLDGAIAVTTPQRIAVLDVEKALYLFQEMQVPVIGLIENMSHFEGKFLFGEGGGEGLAAKFGIPLLAKIPIDPALSLKGVGQEPLFSGLAERLMKVDNDPLPEVEWSDKMLKLTFPDGYLVELLGGKIQEKCPCVNCVQRKGQEGAKIVGAEMVGRYAVKLKFDRGCSSGIYPLTFLRGFSRCGE